MWYEMSYNKPMPTWLQRLQVEPEELDEYTEIQLLIDVYGRDLVGSGDD